MLEADKVGKHTFIIRPDRKAVVHDKLDERAAVQEGREATHTHTSNIKSADFSPMTHTKERAFGLLPSIGIFWAVKIRPSDCCLFEMAALHTPMQNYAFAKCPR